MKRKGLPQKLEEEIINTLVPIFKKYADMKKGHMTKYRILGIAATALRDAAKIAMWKTDNQKMQSDKGGKDD